MTSLRRDIFRIPDKPPIDDRDAVDVTHFGVNVTGNPLMGAEYYGSSR